MKTAGGGKQKGSSFERAVCARLSMWITKGEKEDVFWRSAMSGGRGTQLKARFAATGGHAVGDICAVAPEGHALTDKFFVECKHVKNLSIQTFLLGQEKGLLHSFWQKACEQAKQHGKEPMLIAKQNFQPTLLVMNASRASALFNRPSLCLVFTERAHVFDFDLTIPIYTKKKPTLRRPSDEIQQR
jgi:hypothetical protein